MKHRVRLYVVQFVLKKEPDPSDHVFIFKWMAKQYINWFHPTGAYICLAEFEGVDNLWRKMQLLWKLFKRNMQGAIHLFGVSLLRRMV